MQPDQRERMPAQVFRRTLAPAGDRGLPTCRARIGHAGQVVPSPGMYGGIVQRSASGFRDCVQALRELARGFFPVQPLMMSLNIVRSGRLPGGCHMRMCDM